MRNVVIERASLASELIETVKSDMSGRLVEHLVIERQAKVQEAELLRRALSPLISLIENDPVATVALNEFRETKRASRQPVHRYGGGPSSLLTSLGRAAPLWSPINPGELTVVGPPFDLAWTDRRGNEHGTRSADPSSGVFAFNTGPVAGDWSNQNAGIGVIVTTPEVITAHVTADASFDYAWADSASFVTSHTDGFIGILIHDIDERGSLSVANDSRQGLWSDGTAWLEEHSDSGGGFLQNYIYQIGLTMVPGHRYVIWIWCGGGSDGNLASCRLDAKLYALFLSATAV